MDHDEFVEIMKKKYEQRIKRELNATSDKSGFFGTLKNQKGQDAQPAGSSSPNYKNVPITSKDYKDFLNQFAPPKPNFYEKLCLTFGKLFPYSVKPKEKAELQLYLETAHLNVTPEAVMSFAVVFPILLILFGVAGTFAISFLTAKFEMVLILFVLVAGAFMIKPLKDVPKILATKWRMRASNQMVLAFFYIVTFLRHTANMEAAIRFAANHLAPPLSLDFKKILWDVESGRFLTIEDALFDYLQKWKDYNSEFIETFRIIESSLSEGVESRRLEVLDRALSTILDTTYEKMLVFAQNLKSPIDSLNMMGIVLPILSLIILPLVAGLMEGVEWFHIAMIYNVFIPFLVFYMALGILATRPTGYGGAGIESEFIKARANKKKKVTFLGFSFMISPLAAALLVFAGLFLIGIIPLLIHAVNPTFDFPIVADIIYFLGYIVPEGVGKPIGPFGLGALIFSFAIPLAFALSISTYYGLIYKDLYDTRKESLVIEKEFESTLYILGNRLADGTSPELAVVSVAQNSTDSLVGKFFSIIADNISRLGMGLEEAIFDIDRGALAFYPSNIIESAMKIFVESVKKGYLIASKAMINFGLYLKQIHRVNQRLKDILTEILSSIKSQMSFLTPVIGGVVVAITNLLSLIINLVNSKTHQITNSMSDGGLPATGFGQTPVDFFGVGIPSYFFQIVVGLYVVEVIMVMSYLYATIDSGEDNINRKYLLSQNLSKGVLLYTLVGVILSILFSTITIGIKSFLN